MRIGTVHHISLVVSDLERSRRFYRDVLGMQEIARPNFDFPGAWFAAGTAGQQLHLIVHTNPTFRGSKPLDTRDLHFAVRVPDFQEAVEFLRGKGYREDADPRGLERMIVQTKPMAGFPQIYILDPDRHVVEINAEQAE